MCVYVCVCVWSLDVYVCGAGGKWVCGLRALRARLAAVQPAFEQPAVPVARSLASRRGAGTHAGTERIESDDVDVITSNNAVQRQRQIQFRERKRRHHVHSRNPHATPAPAMDGEDDAVAPRPLPSLSSGRIDDGGMAAVTMSRQDDDPTSPSRQFAFNAMYDAPCIVYSFGSNGEFSFETALHHEMPVCQIHTFDCTVAQSHLNKPSFVQYHPWCVSSHDDETHDAFTSTLTFSLQHIMHKLGHTHMTLMKLDVEMEEFVVLTHMLAALPESYWPKQLLWELHLQPSRASRYRFMRPGPVQIAYEHRGVALATLKLLLLLDAAGYRLIAKEHNPLDDCCVELVHVRMAVVDATRPAENWETDWPRVRTPRLLPWDMDEWLVDPDLNEAERTRAIAQLRDKRSKPM
jgi:hypothetical protein